MDKAKANDLFGEIYDSTYHELSTYVISRIRNVDDAKDLLQIAYTSFYKRLRKKGSIPLEAAIGYLKTTAKHEMGRRYGYIRKREKDISLDDKDISQEIIESISSDGIEESVLDSVFLEQIWDMIAKKGDLTYRIFVLHFTFGLTLEETAKCLEIPMSAVTNRIYRTKKALKEQFFYDCKAEQVNYRKEPVTE